MQVVNNNVYHRFFTILNNKMGGKLLVYECDNRVADDRWVGRFAEQNRYQEHNGGWVQLSEWVI